MNGRPFRVVEYATDITADKLQRIAFEGQIDAIRKSQGIITFDMAGTILDINDKMLASLGHAREALLGRHHSVLVDPAQVDTPHYATFWDTLRAGTFLSGLYERRGKDGRTVWFQASYNPILDLNGRPLKVLKIASDVSSQVALAEAYEDARRQTQHDSATALPNRIRLSAFLTSALAPPCGRVVVLYMDIDGFKAVNLAFGHAAGDRALGDMADRLRRCLSNDQLAARVGGDAFVVVAPDLPDDEIAPFCQRLLDAAAVPIVHDGEELALGLSIGVAIAPMDGTSPDQLLRCADAALQRSKQGGRGTFTFYAAAMNDRILAYRALVEDMRRGIAADEFFLEYQPRFDPRNRRLQSVEALVRWRHPQRGRVNPADFIPLAEKSGLIVQLGTWVLRTACQAAAAWDGIGVSVNVSPVQFRSTGLVPTVMEALTDAGLDPHRLELEITEGVLLEDAERAGTELNALKALGVKLAMDDFGTGYSSLSSLRSFPFDVIKIDRNFVADMDVRKGGREVVQAILGLGRALGLSVTAEGVETPDPADDADARRLPGGAGLSPGPAHGGRSHHGTARDGRARDPGGAVRRLGGRSRLNGPRRGRGAGRRPVRRRVSPGVAPAATSGHHPTDLVPLFLLRCFLSPTQFPYWRGRPGPVSTAAATSSHRFNRRLTKLSLNGSSKDWRGSFLGRAARRRRTRKSHPESEANDRHVRHPFRCVSLRPRPPVPAALDLDRRGGGCRHAGGAGRLLAHRPPPVGPAHRSARRRDGAAHRRLPHPADRHPPRPRPAGIPARRDRPPRRGGGHDGFDDPAPRPGASEGRGGAP